METQSIWFSPNNEFEFAPFKGNEEVDVTIIGGGITGITAAYLLSQTGLKVKLLEANKLGVSNTGRSTGNLYCTMDVLFQDLLSKYDSNTILKVLQSREEAINFIEKTIQTLKIDCDFKRVPWVLFSGAEEVDKKIEKEYAHAMELGLKVEWLDKGHELLRPLKGRVGLKLDHQAQFNPYDYVLGVARILSQQGCSIHEGSRVLEIDKDGDLFSLTTDQGTLITKHLIEATHTPIGFSALQTVLGPYREYGVASKTTRPLVEDGIFWGRYDVDKKFSVRHYKDHLLIIGQPHKVGQGSSLEGIEHLKEFGQKMFALEEYQFEWGGQHYRPADLLPYIGRRMGSNSFVATGFSTDGLVYGTLAALIIKDEILGIQNSYAELYRSNRITPLKSAYKFIKENMNVAQKYAEDYLHREEIKDLGVDQGMVVNEDGRRYAINKDEEGHLHVCSAVCPHLGCIVHWNEGERTWDCPCHGSRFDRLGHVIEGPALKGLETVHEPKIGEVNQRSSEAQQ
ncbi:FAD-dependent oxidoreductase [Peredibacter starrii]|uniref:FAD-dependent oxidoreductase n=1 Tax=Peredibacter starrii TaxID=28202 RepID=A0AAX4HM13_9BACT|nr:FAD-dependent oxidoreductase [Peredibacter starrii]WPU64202.1 FAD-dependent oxidoreductase [Peredibacter starrii]